MLLCRCQQEATEDDYLDFYGSWVIRFVSGGFSGGGFKPGFDYMEVKRKNSYYLYKDDVLVGEGTIEKTEQSSDSLKIRFISSNGISPLEGLPKTVALHGDTLLLDEECADCYSFFFIRCEAYDNETFYRSDTTLNYITVTKYKIGIDKVYTSAYFVNENTGFISCTDGSILKTINGGQDWEIISTGYELPIYAICFINQTTGFAAGGEKSCGGTGCTVPGSIILKTTDGGENWEKRDIPYHWSEIAKLRFISQTKGFALGTGIRLMTTDGGTSWQDFETDYMGYVYDLEFLNETTGYFTGLMGTLYKTTNGGASWQEINPGTFDQLFSIDFVSETTGYLGSYLNLMKTVDGGNTWMLMDNSPSGVTAMNFTSENNGVVFGYREYASGHCNVWNSYIHLLKKSQWVGDKRVSSVVTPFALNPNKFYTITYDNELEVIEIVQ